MSDPHANAAPTLLQQLDALLAEEVAAASLLLTDIRQLRERLEQSPALPDLAADLPHHARLQQLQALAQQRTRLMTTLDGAPLPAATSARSAELGELARALLEENTALGRSLELRLLFFRRLLQPLSVAAATGVYARDGNVQATLAPRTLDTI